MEKVVMTKMIKVKGGENVLFALVSDPEYVCSYYAIHALPMCPDLATGKADYVDVPCNTEEEAIFTFGLYVEAGKSGPEGVGLERSYLVEPTDYHPVD